MAAVALGSSFSGLAGQGHMFENKKWVKNLPRPKDEEEKNNLIQNVLFKAGLAVFQSKEEYDSLPELHKIISKFSVDPDYRLDPLSEDERGWLVALDIDVNDAECTTYLEDFLEKRKTNGENWPEQKENSTNYQRNKQN